MDSSYDDNSNSSGSMDGRSRVRRLYVRCCTFDTGTAPPAKGYYSGLRASFTSIRIGSVHLTPNDTTLLSPISTVIALPSIDSLVQVIALRCG